MNIFIIPSWYPSVINPIQGVFFREQAEALADLAPEIQVIVSVWDQYNAMLSVRKPWRWPRCFLWRLLQKNNNICLRNGVYEIFNPKILWSGRLPFGGIRRMLNVNRRNFSCAKRKFGKIDIIHAHVSYPGGYIASVLAQENDIPYVLTEHMSPFPFSSYLHDGQPLSEITQAFQGAAASIAVSPSLAAEIASFGYAMPEIIPNLVDERFFFPKSVASDKIIFLTVCVISEQKGIDQLLAAIALWNPPADRFEFRIVGDGPQRSVYEAKAHELGIDDRVRWLGAVNRSMVSTLFRDCHIFVLPSRHESFGVVFAEAIACGKPIIATRCGGPESIVNTINGKLVDVGDALGLSRDMQKMVDNLEKYDPQAIRADFEARFSRQAIVRQLCELYDRILNR
jgi:glycosyltransferase involved in cell wall biosynthesis